MVYAGHFSLYSSQSKENMIDETLSRIYFSNCKTLLTTRAGLHHRRVIFCRNVLIFLGSYPCSYSLLSTQAVQLKPNSIEQSIILGGFFSLCQFLRSPKHSFEPWRENKRGSCLCFQLFVSEPVCRYHRLRCLFLRMLAHSRNVLMQQSLQVLLQPILFACQKLSKSIKRLEVADCSTIYGSSQLFNTGSLFLSPSTHRNNCGFYFYLLEILKELCLCLRCWPHPKYVYMHSTQCNTNTTFLDHFNGPSEHISCKFLLGVFIAVLSIAALSSEHVWPVLANSRTFDVQRISMIFQCAIPYFDWIFSFDHACVFLELYKHYLARKC